MDKGNAMSYNTGMAVTKKTDPTSFRLTPEALELAEALTQKLGLTRTALMELALRRLAEVEGVKPARRKKPAK